MNTLSYKTVSANANTVNKEWVLIDAENEILGRMASAAAKILRGKHKPNYTPHVDCGDNVIIINADKIRLTGNKWDAKRVYTSQWISWWSKVTNSTRINGKKPTAMVEKAIKGMLPKTILGADLFRNLYVYAGFRTRTASNKNQRKSI